MPDTGRLANAVTDAEIEPHARSIHAALKRFADTSHIWPERNAAFRQEHDDDQFYRELAPIWGAEHTAMLQECSRDIVHGIAEICRLYGVRFMSLSERDFITFEGMRRSATEYNWPLTWLIADKIDDVAFPNYDERRANYFSHNGGNGPQSQISLKRINPHGRFTDHAVQADWLGCYDLRDGCVRVAEPVDLYSMRRDAINEPYRDGDDLAAYFFACGARDPRYRWIGRHPNMTVERI